MPPPSPLVIATSSLNRLVKEEKSYHRELEQQQARIAKLQQPGGAEDEENAEYQLRQENKSLDETKAIIPEIRAKIQDALSVLQKQLEKEAGGEASVEDITKAKEAVAAGLTAVRESS